MAGLRADQLPLYKKDMYKAEREGYDEVPTTYNKIFFVKEAVTGAGDKVSQVLGAQQLTRHTSENQQIDYASPSNGWEFLVKYHTYSAGLSLGFEAVEDTVKLGNLLNDLAQTWGRQNRRAKEKLAARMFNEGGTLSGDWVFNGTHVGNADSSGDMLYDGSPLFALNNASYLHTTKSGNTYYNSVASLALTPSNFETIYQLHVTTNAFDEAGDEIENPVDTVLTKSGTDQFLADRIFSTPRSQGMPFGQNNDVNPYFGIINNKIGWRYLNDTADVFYIGKARSTDFQFHERMRPRLRFFRDENTAGYKVSNMLRIGILIKNFRAWSRGGGTSGA